MAKLENEGKIKQFGNVRYICPFICLPGLLEMPEQQVCQKTEKVPY